ncbi:MAG: hypothetical protein GXP27_19065, partial [Planctomycetes bacterium]|nr:hypothetical protein [Planctomycetota bacterium]
DAAAKPAPRVGLTGRITYKTSSGASRPDRGARVLVFPEKRRGGVKLPVVGFRPGDDAADFEIAVAALRALGGNAAIVDETGNYSLTLPAAGKYTVVVLSRYQARSEDSPIVPELVAIIAEFFDGAPERLLGQVRYHMGRVAYNGSEPITWDYSFEQQ